VDGDLAYVDASAFVKLVVAERESDVLLAATDGWRLASSALLQVEALRAVRRRVPDRETAIRRRLGGVEIVGIGAAIREAAGALGDPYLRSLDAVHVATALSLGNHVGAFFTYDKRLAAAAQAHGLPVTVPQP
jgi:predicted nucleic acid-binding protein